LIAAGAIVLGSVLMLSLAWGLQHAALSRPESVIGNTAPGIAIETVDGSQVSLNGVRGKPVVLDFWASWCVSCAEDLRILSSASAAHPGIAFIGADMQDTAGGFQTFEQRHPHPYPAGRIVSGDYKNYGVFSPPVTFFIDSHGVVVASFAGPLDATTVDHYLGLIA
jgi:cytochrome c biogenesis protein CcmG/thiol:disulfide interchange protein DsbE